MPPADILQRIVATRRQRLGVSPAHQAPPSFTGSFSLSARRGESLCGRARRAAGEGGHRGGEDGFTSPGVARRPLRSREARPRPTPRRGRRPSRWWSSRTSSSAATSCSPPARPPAVCRRSPRSSWSICGSSTGRSRPVPTRSCWSPRSTQRTSSPAGRRGARARPGAARRDPRRLRSRPLVGERVGDGRGEQPRSAHLRSRSRALDRDAAAPAAGGARRRRERHHDARRRRSGCRPPASTPSSSARACCSARIRRQKLEELFG